MQRKKSKTLSYRVPIEFHLALLEQQQKLVKKMSRQDLLRQLAKKYFKKKKK